MWLEEQVRRRLGLFAGIGVAASVCGVWAADGVWGGSASAVWADHVNWSAAYYPGYGTGETATFNGAGNGNTTLSLLGLQSILNVVFESSGVAAYVIGTGGANAQTLVMESGGLFRLGEDAGNGPTVNAAVRLGADTAAGAYTFRNESTGHALTFAGDVSGGAAGGAPGSKTLTVSGAGETRIDGIVSDGGASAVGIVSEASGTVVLSAANTHSGGTAVQSGTLTASHVQALGTGPVVNDGVLNLTVPQSEYTGLSSGLSGTGTVNVTLGTGANLNVLDGDASGFSGEWRVGIGAAPASGRARMNGADNAAAVIHVLPHASLFVSNAVTKRATAILYGGNICDQHGQLRLENNAEWAGPVIFAGDITDSADGLIGNNVGYGTVSGTISDMNGPHPFEKRGTGTLALTATNSTYAGWTWCRGGSFIVTALGNLGEPSSLGAPLTPGNNVLKLGSASTSASLIYTGTGGTTDRVIDMAGTTGGGAITHSGTGVLTFMRDLVVSGEGSKTFSLGGSTAGEGVFAGVIGDYDATRGTSLMKTGTGMWTLAGENVFTGGVTVDDGALRIFSGGALGAGVKTADLIGNTTTRNPRLLIDGSGAPVVIPADISFRASNKKSGAFINVAGSNRIEGAVSMVAGDNDLHVWSQSGKLTFSGGIAIADSVSRNLYLRGAGDGEISGVLASGTAPGLTLYKDQGAGVWTLSGNNTFAGNINIDDGGLRITNAAALGTGTKTLRITGDTGTRDPRLFLDGTGGPIILPATVTLRTSNKKSGPIIHVAGTNTIQGEIRLAAGDHDTHIWSRQGKLTLEGSIYAEDALPRQLYLRGDGDGEVSGVISNGLNAAMPVIKDAGTGVWAFTAENTYSGPTTVGGGTLVLSGASGSIRATSGVTLTNGATLLLDNVAASNADRVGDAATVTFDHGTLEFSHGGGAADYSETVGGVTVFGGQNVIRVSRADSGQTSVLTLASLVRQGEGTLDFSGEGLGADARSRVFIAGQAEGPLGYWATVNGTEPAYYDSTLGVIGISGVFTDSEIAARGPGSVIPDDATKSVRITTPGTDGPITLAGDPVTTVAQLRQDTETAAEVDTASKTLRAYGVAVSEGMAALTLGVNPGEGALAPLAQGGALALDNHSSSPLTVNAALADNGSASTVAKGGAGEVRVNGPVQHTGATIIAEGTLAYGGHEAPQTVAVSHSGSGTLAKRGTNLLHLTASNTYTGPTVIHQGIVRPDTDQTFGTADGGTFVAGGATLDIGCTPDVGGTRAANALNIRSEVVTVAGAGPDGRGVIVNSATGAQVNALGNVTLAGNATFSGISRWDIRNGTLSMNGNRITKTGENMVGLNAMTVVPGETGEAAFDVAGGIFRLQGSTRLNGSASNTITVRSGAEVELYQLTNPQEWRLIFENGTTFDAANNSTASTQNRWAGPITLEGAFTLAGGDNTGYVADLQGEISGAGSISKTGMAYITISGTNNTYAGPTAVLNTRLYITSLRNVGEPSSLGRPMNAADGAIKLGNGTSATALVYTGAGDTTDRAIEMAGTTGNAVVYQNGTGPLKFTSDVVVSGVGSKPLTLRGTSSVGAELAGRVANAEGSTIAVAKEDGGSWLLSNTNTYSGTTTVNAGSLAFTGSNTLAGAIAVNNSGSSLAFSGRNTLSGSVTLSSGTALAVSGTNTFSGSFSMSGSASALFGGSNEMSAVTVNGGSLRLEGTVHQPSSSLLVSGASAANGVLRMSAGSRLSGPGMFSVGRSNGAFYLDGGTLVRNTPTGDGEWFAFGYNAGGYGYFNVNGGTVATPRMQLGPSSGSALGIGIARITSGTLTLTANMHISRHTNSVGVLTLDGGLFDRSTAATECNIGYSGGRGELNITGGTFDNSGRNIYIRNNSNTPTGIVNLCAGALKLNAFQINSPGVGWINFMGGTLRAATTGQTILPSGLTAVRTYAAFGAYAGGAVIDTDGKNVTVAKPVIAPEGNGVYAIAVADGGSGYIGEPYVSIRGGGGEGATAVANMTDDGTGNGTYRVVSITVTCPGFGYTTAPDIAFLRGGYGATEASAGSVTLAPNASGGLQKIGAGALTLGTANTYTGVTTVTGGTLKLGNAAALPTQTRVVLAGGTLDLSGYTVTNAVSGSGVLTNGTVETVLSPGGAGAVATDTLALAAGTALRGAYLLDVTPEGASDLVAVQGSINLDLFTLEVVDPEQLNRTKTYTILTCTGTRTGRLTPLNLPDSRWRVVAHVDGSVRLLYVTGTMMSVR